MFSKMMGMWNVIYKMTYLVFVPSKCALYTFQEKAEKLEFLMRWSAAWFFGWLVACLLACLLSGSLDRFLGCVVGWSVRPFVVWFVIACSLACVIGFLVYRLFS